MPRASRLQVNRFTRIMRSSTDLFDPDPLDVGAYTVVVRVLTTEDDMGGQSCPLDT